MEARTDDNARTLLPKREDPWLRLAVILWGILAVAAGVKACVQPHRHTTYPIFARAAQHWWADETLYGDPSNSDQYRYSPTFAIAMTPFGLLPDRLGGALWNVCSAVLLVWSLRVLVREVLPGKWPPWREGLLLGLTLVVATRGIWSGQSNALLLAMVFFSLAAIRHEKWWAASFLLSATFFIKIWPMALILLLAACWPRQLSWRVPLACIPLALVPFLTRPFHVVCQQYYTWYQFLTQIQHARWPGYRDAWTIWEECWPPVNAPVYLVLQLAAAGALLAWCLWQRRRSHEVGAVLTAIVSGWAAWQLLFGPGSERLTYLLLAPMASWAVLVSWQERRHRILSISAWLMLGILGTGGVERSLSSWFPIAPAILPLGAVAFAIWLALWHTGTSPAQTLSLPNEGAAEAPLTNQPHPKRQAGCAA